MTELTTAVRKLYQRPEAAITIASQQTVPRISINLLTRDLTLHHGEAQDTQGRFSWQIIRKHISRGPHRNKPLLGVDQRTHQNYWRREAEVYQSGFLRGLAPGLVAPRLGNLIELPDDQGCLLDLEYIAPASEWTIERFARVARMVGVWQGRYLVEPLPSEPWFYRPGPFSSAPQTLCHSDLWAANLLWRDEEAFLLDWSMLGIGPFGRDIASLVFDSVWMMQTPASNLGALEVAALDSYCAGLCEAGLRGDDAWVRRAFATCAALQFSTLSRSLAAVSERPIKQQNLEARFGRPWREVLSARLAVTERALALSAQLA